MTAPNLTNLSTYDLLRLRDTLRRLAILFWVSVLFLPVCGVFMIFKPIVAVIVLLIVVLRSLMVWQLTCPLPGEAPPHSRWRRLARYMALLQPVAPLLIMVVGFISMRLDDGSSPNKLYNGSLTILIAVLTAILIWRIIEGLQILSLLAYVAQLARRTGHRADGIWASAFLVPLSQLMWCALLALLIFFAVDTHYEPSKSMGAGIIVILILPVVLAAELLTTVWAGVVLWRVAGRINHLAK